MTPSNAFSLDCFTIVDSGHVRVLWSDLEAAFDVGGLAVNPPIALIRGVLARCGAPGWVWDAEGRTDETGVVFRRVWSRSAD